MNLNRTIPRIGAAVAAAAVFLFAICLIIDFTFGSYTVCMFLPIGYIMMAAGFHHECAEDRVFSSHRSAGIQALRQPEQESRNPRRFFCARGCIRVRQEISHKSWNNSLAGIAAL